MSDEDRESLSKSLYTDYLSSNDVEEAVSAAQELVIPGFGPTLVNLGIHRAYDLPSMSEQSKTASLVIELVSHNVISFDDVLGAVTKQTEILDDTMLDIPSAPKVLGEIMGTSVAKNLVSLPALISLAQGIEGAEARRGLVASALVKIKEISGQEEMTSMVHRDNIDVAGLFEKDPEIEAYLPDTNDFLKEQGLESLI